jgi:hypothetical protein
LDLDKVKPDDIEEKSSYGNHGFLSAISALAENKKII